MLDQRRCCCVDNPFIIKINLRVIISYIHTYIHSYPSLNIFDKHKKWLNMFNVSQYHY